MSSSSVVVSGALSHVRTRSRSTPSSPARATKNQMPSNACAIALSRCAYQCRDPSLAEPSPSTRPSGLVRLIPPPDSCHPPEAAMQHEPQHHCERERSDGYGPAAQARDADFETDPDVPAQV